MGKIDATNNDMLRISEVVRAIANHTRYKMICLIGTRAISLTNLAKIVSGSYGMVSQQLALLKAAGLVVLRRMSNCVYCRIVDSRVLHVYVIEQRGSWQQKKRQTRSSLVCCEITSANHCFNTLNQ